MREIRWSSLKSERLKRARGASFEDIINSKLVAVKQHPKKEHQNIMLFLHKNYIWVVPYIEEETGFFLKTLFPSRKYTKMYKKGEL